MSRPIEEIEADIETNDLEWMDAILEVESAIHKRTLIDVKAKELRQELDQAKKETANAADTTK